MFQELLSCGVLLHCVEDLFDATCLADADPVVVIVTRQVLEHPAGLFQQLLGGGVLLHGVEDLFDATGLADASLDVIVK